MWTSFCLAMSSIESGEPSTSGLYGGGKNFEDNPDADMAVRTQTSVTVTHVSMTRDSGLSLGTSVFLERRSSSQLHLHKD
jgi:hypothetical protein